MSRTRLESLDTLRGLAVILVLFRHVSVFAAPESWPQWWQGVLGPLQKGGWIGVDLFFVLSGFLVSGLLFGEYQSTGRIVVGRFLVRRGFKIYPSYYFFLISTCLLIASVSTYELTTNAIFREAVFVQNYLPAIWIHTWSLAVEEHFYLLLPLLLLGLLRLRRGQADPFRLLGPIFLLVALVCLLLRYEMLTHRTIALHEIICPTHLRIDSLLFGAVLGYVYHFHHDWLRQRISGAATFLVIAGGALLLPAFVWPLETSGIFYPPWFTVAYLGSGFLLLAALTRTEGITPVERVVGYLGRHSYTIYLWHVPVALIAISQLQKVTNSSWSFGVSLLVYLVLSLVVGVVTGFLVERPFLYVRDRLVPRPAPALTSESIVSVPEPSPTSAVLTGVPGS